MAPQRLVSAHMLMAMGDKLLGRHVRAILRNDRRMHRLARHADDAGLADGRVREKHALDLDRVDVLVCGGDRVLRPSAT